MKRRICFGALTAALLCTYLILPAQAARRSVAVQVDAAALPGACYVESGVTYVPLRSLLDALGGWRLYWDGTAAQAEAASASLTADPASGTVTVGGTAIPGRVTVENGRTYVPLRAVGEALGCTVTWDPYFGGAAVTSPSAAYDAMDLYWLSRIICAESGAESAEGQTAVGTVVLNRVRSSEFPDTVAAVIFDRKDAVQFEPVGNGTVYRTPSAEAVAAAKRALGGENTVGQAMYFYAPALSQGVWINANRTYLRTIGCHRFYL